MTDVDGLKEEAQMLNNEISKMRPDSVEEAEILVDKAEKLRKIVKELEERGEL
jgi:hypothetical protein